MTRYDIIRRPLGTEKTDTQRKQFNQISFEVDRRANRIEIKRAVKSIFNVNVTCVRTMQVRGKTKRRGRIVGKRRDWKKAIVTLAPGERIKFFEEI